MSDFVEIRVLLVVAEGLFAPIDRGNRRTWKTELPAISTHGICRIPGVLDFSGREMQGERQNPPNLKSLNFRREGTVTNFVLPLSGSAIGKSAAWSIAIGVGGTGS